MEEKDIRWKQRFSNYKKALAKLSEGVELMSIDGSYATAVTEMMQEGLIQRFEYTLELAWNVMKDYERFQGITEIQGSRSALRQALAMGLITDREWMNSVDDRNLSTHDYDQDTADEIRDKIISIYYPLFVDFEKTMEKKLNE